MPVILNRATKIRTKQIDLKISQLWTGKGDCQHPEQIFGLRKRSTVNCMREVPWHTSGQLLSRVGVPGFKPYSQLQLPDKPALRS